MSKTSLDSLPTPYVVIGAGKSGLSAVYFLAHYLKHKKNLTVENNLFIFDEKNPSVKFEVTSQVQQLTAWQKIAQLNVGTLVVSPGVPLQNENIKHLLSLGWTLSSEISLAASLLTTEIVVGVTGSVAKSTVVSLIGEAFKAEDAHAFVGGNLGTPFCDYGLKLLKGETKAKYVALELSSYQLENCENLKLHSSAITFLSANHLERYNSLHDYYLQKCFIGNLTENVCVLNENSPDLVNYQNKINCKTNLVCSQKFQNQELLSHLNIIGKHNQDNFCLAYEIVRLLNLSNKAVKAMQSFKGLEHRIETVLRANDILFINDSKATAMDSVKVALEAALTQITTGKVYLLLGGKDKNLPWNELAYLKNLKQVTPIFFGQCGEVAKEAIFKNSEHKYLSTLKECLPFVFKMAKAGDVVLLSPGGTSLDEFKGFDDRGRFFKEEVKKYYLA